MLLTGPGVQDIVGASHLKAYTKKCTLLGSVNACVYIVLRAMSDYKRAASSQFYSRSAITRCDRSVTTASCGRSEARDQLNKVSRVHCCCPKALSLPVRKVIAR